MRVGKLTVLAALLWPVTAAASPWSFGGELGATYDDNVGNASGAGDRRATTRIGAGAQATYTHPLGLFAALQLRGALDGEADLEFQQLSYGRADARARFLWKPGESFFAPVLAPWISAGHRQFGSGLRDSEDYRAGAYLAQPLTTRLQGRLGFAWSRRDARSRVFDGQARSYEASLDWALTPGLTLYGEYRRDDGPIVISAEGVVTPKSEHLYLYPAASAVERDEALGRDWYAYRFAGRTAIAALGANVPLGRDFALDAQLRWAHSTLDANYTYGGGGGGTTPPDNGYDRWLGDVSLLMRF